MAKRHASQTGVVLDPQRLVATRRSLVVLPPAKLA